MESADIIQYLKEKTILVIGATGFLGKIFTEKILRIQPNVKKLYLLVRAKDANSAKQPILNDVVEKELFRVLRDKLGGNLHSFMSEKVAPVAGDIACENLGVKDSNLREEMWGKVDLVLNFAATTKFDERYDVALHTNAMAAFHVLSFAKRCVKIKMFLHVSTAYVCCETSGVITEKSICLGKTLKETSNLDINAEWKLAEETLNQLQAADATEEAVTSTMKDLGLKRSRLCGWPNTYVFTKAMGEMLLCYYKDNLPLVILRPTIITSTYKEPFPGWIESLRTMDSVISAYGKGKLSCLPASLDTILDLIPADMVVNALMTAMVANANQYSSPPIIYHVGSSMRNPVKISDIHECMYRYFIKHPYVDRNGKTAVQVNKCTILSSWDKFQSYMAIRYLLPLKGLEVLNLVFCNCYKNICMESDRKIKLAMRLAELYKPYMFFQGRFDNTNLEKLRTSIKENELEVDVFNFDPNCIDWEDYIINTHIPGLVRYVIGVAKISNSI